MNVALVIFGEITSRSGGYLYDRHLVAALQAAGHSVTVVSQKRGRVHERFYPLERTIGWAGSARNAIIAADPDIVVVDELNHAAAIGLFGGIRRNLPGVPVAALVHHLRGDECDASWHGITRRFERHFLAHCDAFLFNSRTTRDRVFSVLSGSASGAHYGAARRPARFRSNGGSISGPPPALVATPGRPDGPGTPDVTIPDTDGVNRGTNVPAGADMAPRNRSGICFVGNVIPRKNLHVLVAALRHLPEPWRRLDVYGSLTSDTAYSGVVKDLVTELSLEDSVTFHGEVSDGTIREAYRRHHLLVVPSSYEGFGIVYLEAMLNGCIPVAGSRGGAGEIISDGADGVLVPPGDPLILAERIGSALSDAETMDRLAGAARRKAYTFPSWSDSMATAVRFLEDLAGATVV